LTLKQEGEYVLEKQVNGQGVSPYDPSHNSTAVLVGTSSCRLIFLFRERKHVTDVCNFYDELNVHRICFPEKFDRFLVEKSNLFLYLFFFSMILDLNSWGFLFV
jgi:hypothetical protein